MRQQHLDAAHEQRDEGEAREPMRDSHEARVAPGHHVSAHPTNLSLITTLAGRMSAAMPAIPGTRPATVQAHAGVAKSATMPRQGQHRARVLRDVDVGDAHRLRDGLGRTLRQEVALRLAEEFRGTQTRTHVNAVVCLAASASRAYLAKVSPSGLAWPT